MFVGPQRLTVLTLLAVLVSCGTPNTSPEGAAKAFLEARFVDPAKGLRVVRKAEWPLIVAFDYTRIAHGMASLPAGISQSATDPIAAVVYGLVPKDVKLTSKSDVVELARKLATEITAEQAQTLTTKLSALARENPARAPVPPWRIVKVEREGDRVSLTVQDKEDTITFAVVREGDKWYVDIESFLDATVTR